MNCITGGEDGTYRDEIIAWLDEEQKWEETGKMKMARYYHAVTTIQLDDQAMDHCGWRTVGGMEVVFCSHFDLKDVLELL